MKRKYDLYFLQTNTQRKIILSEIPQQIIYNQKYF